MVFNGQLFCPAEDIWQRDFLFQLYGSQCHLVEVREAAKYSTMYREASPQRVITDKNINNVKIENPGSHLSIQKQCIQHVVYQGKAITYLLFSFLTFHQLIPRFIFPCKVKIQPIQKLTVLWHDVFPGKMWMQVPHFLFYLSSYRQMYVCFYVCIHLFMHTHM